MSQLSIDQSEKTYDPSVITFDDIELISYEVSFFLDIIHDYYGVVAYLTFLSRNIWNTLCL